MSKNDQDSPWRPSAAQAGVYLSVHMNTIKRWEKSGRLLGYRTRDGGTLRFRREDLDAVMEPDPERSRWPSRAGLESSVSHRYPDTEASA